MCFCEFLDTIPFSWSKIFKLTSYLELFEVLVWPIIIMCPNELTIDFLLKTCASEYMQITVPLCPELQLDSLFFSRTCRRAVYHCINRRRELQHARTHPTVMISYNCRFEDKERPNPTNLKTQARSSKEREPLSSCRAPKLRFLPSKTKGCN